MNDTPALITQTVNERVTLSLTRLLPVTIKRIIPFVIGFILICLGQYILIDQFSYYFNISFAEALEELFKINIPNLENTIIGSVISLVGVILVFISFGRVQLEAIASPTSENDYPKLRTFLKKYLLFIVLGLATSTLLLWQMHWADRSAYLFFVWLFSIFILSFVAYKYDRNAKTSLNPFTSRWDIFWIVVLFVGGLLLNAYMLDRIPNNLLGDEGAFIERASYISSGREEFSFFDVGVYSYPLASSFYQAGILKLFNDTFFGWRFSSVLSAVLTVIPLYLLTKDLFNRKVAVLAGLMLVTLPYFITFARLGYNNAQSIFPVALCVYFVYTGAQRKSALYLALAGIAAGIGFYTYTAGRLGAIIGGLYLVYLIGSALSTRLFRKDADIKKFAWRDTKIYVLALFIFVVFALMTFLPHMIFTNVTAPELLRYKLLESLFPNSFYAMSVYPETELYRDFLPIQVYDQTFFFRADLYARFLISGVVRSVLAYHQQFQTMGLYNFSPLAGWVGVVFYTVGFVMTVRYIRQKEFVLLFIWWFFGNLLLSMINTFPPRYQHTVPVMPVIAIWIALGLSTFVDALRQLIQNLLKKVLHIPPQRIGFVFSGVVTVFIVGFIMVHNLYNYFIEMPRFYGPRYEDIIAFDVIHGSEDDLIIYVGVNATDAFWTPYILDFMTYPSHYEAVHIDRLLQGDFELQPNKHYIFYFNRLLQEEATEYLRETLNQEDIEPTPVRDDMSRLLGFTYNFVAPSTNN